MDTNASSSTTTHHPTSTPLILPQNPLHPIPWALTITGVRVAINMRGDCPETMMVEGKAYRATHFTYFVERDDGAILIVGEKVELTHGGTYALFVLILFSRLTL